MVGRFTVFMAGCGKAIPVELDASSVHEVGQLVGSRRFVAGELIDMPDDDGVCANRRALIPVSRINLIVEADA